MLTSVNLPRKGGSYVIDAAMRLVARDGPEALTMRAVADEAGVSAAALYRHYRDKSDLVRELVQVAHREFRAYLARGQSTKGAVPRLRMGWRLYLTFAIERAPMYRLLFVEEHGVGIDRFPDDFRTGRSSTFRALTAAVKACLDEGALLVTGPAHEVALALFAQMHGLVMLHYAGRFGGDDRLFRRFAMRALRRGLLRTASDRGHSNHHA
jgi:AcrR family transcriptional regulator